MPIVRIRDEDRPGGLAEDALVLPDIPERVSLRDLIRTRVREEVARANADRWYVGRLLVAPTEAEQTANDHRVRKRIDWERQADVAVEAFEQQAFFVFVDGQQVEDLDGELALGINSEVRFLRLTPLVGG